MPTTSNFGWTTPADTDLVKDGAAAIRTLGNGIDTSLVDLKGGTTGQVLAKASNTDLDFTWSSVDPLTILDAKGDLITATAADTPARLASSGVNGQVLTVDTSTSTGLKWATPSSGPLNFTIRNSGFSTSINTIAYNGSNLYVAAGSSGGLFTSSDAKTWTSRTSGFGSSAIRKVIFANSLWVAVGVNGLISTSTDGITWTARTANMGTNSIADVYYADSLFVAVGAGGGTTNTGGITYSSDGITWTRKSQSITVGANYNGVIYNGTNWVVVANNSTNNVLYASTPSGTWTAAAFGGGASSNELTGIWFDGTRTWVIDLNYWWYSTSTTLATATVIDNIVGQSGGSPNRQHYYYDGRIYSAQGGLFYSWSTTPGTNTSTVTGKTAPIIHPDAYAATSGSAFNFPSTGLYADATGIIIGGSYGQIYTSF